MEPPNRPAPPESPLSGGAPGGAGPLQDAWQGRRTEARVAGEYWTELVELYEYKVHDLLVGRLPRGGRRSLGDLRDLLTAAPLDSALLRRFGRADREWRAFLRARSGQADRPPAQSLPAQALSTPSLPAPSPSVSPALQSPPAAQRGEPAGAEALALEGLRVTLWLAQARGQVRAAAAAWLREPDRMTLRVAYALHVLLERGEHEMAVPLYGDPLTSLGNSAVAQTLMTDLLGQLAALARADLMAGSRPEAARRRLAAAVQRVTENPYPRTDDQDELEARLRAAEREGLGPELVGALALSARSGSGQGRPGEERARIRTAGAALLSFLGGLLPDPHAAEAADTAAEGEGHTIASLPALPERGLHALNPARRLLQPDDSAHSLLLRLSGPPEAQWRGLPLMWRRAGEGWTVRLHTRDYRLSADPADQPDGVAVQFGAQPGLALLYGDYLLLTLSGDRAARRERLLHLLRLARAVAALLDPGGAYLNLRLARAAAALLRGDPVEPASVDVHSAERYAAVSEGALLEFARRGAGDLLLHLRPRPEEQVRPLFARAAALVGAPGEQGQALLHALRVAALLEPDPSEPPGVPAPGETPALTRPGMVLSLPTQPEPLTVRFLGRALTLRPDYKGELAAVLPGRPAALVGDLLALPVAGSTLLIVRQEDELLLSFQAAPAPGV